ncbi:hypothetical protein EXIGUO9Y_130037 [Exiguobacterium oxidotolerans]|uniref:Uncharacterized protein n=1 Tax=Exiguobacterium oxidotolerans TaxID=223958 RepID=A0A653I4I6_9BACL|nr:hypothetical protein EXIGUO9Y_130037 [Exiguobacterium oxidotolerans]
MKQNNVISPKEMGEFLTKFARLFFDSFMAECVLRNGSHNLVHFYYF